MLDEFFALSQRSFAELNQLKVVVKLHAKFKKNTVADVYFPLLNDLLDSVSSQLHRDENAKNDRLIAMQIALHYEKASATMFLMKKVDEHSLMQLRDILKRHESVQSNAVPFLVNFKSLTLLASKLLQTSSGSEGESFLSQAREMYATFISDSSKCVYDNLEIFSQTVEMKPLDRGESIDQVNCVFINGLKAIKRWHGREKRLRCVVKIELMILKTEESVIKVNPSKWFHALLSFVRFLRDNRLTKMSGYYLLLGFHAFDFVGDYFEEKESRLDVEMRLTSLWMDHLFEMISLSSQFFGANFSSDDLKPLERLGIFSSSSGASSKTLTPQTAYENIGDGLHCESFEEKYASRLIPDFEVPFDCCESVESKIELRKCLKFTVDSFCRLLQGGIVSQFSLEFIKLHYQLSDVLLIQSAVEGDAEKRFDLLKQRLEWRHQMIAFVRTAHPKAFATVSQVMFTDLNEILRDLLECNVQRASNASLFGDQANKC